MTDSATLATAGADPVVTNESVSVPAPEIEKQAPATPAEAAQPQTEQTTEDQGEPAAEKPEKDDAKKNSFKERIDRERDKKRDAERRAETAERTASDLQRQLSELRQEYQKLDPNDVQGQQALQTRAAVKAERLEQMQVEGRSAAQEAVQSRATMFNDKIDAARERIPDLDQALANFQAVPVSEVAADLIATSEKAAELAHFLGRNPAEAHRIHRLPPHMQGAELARIESRLSSPVRKPSNAPPPVRTNLGSGATPPAAKSHSEMSMDEYAKDYAARQAAKGR